MNAPGKFLAVFAVKSASRCFAILCLVTLSLGGVARASVVVFANRADRPVTFVVDQAVRRTFTLESGALLPVAVLPTGEVAVTFESDGHALNYALDLDSAYYFHTTELGGVNLQQIGIPRRIPVEATDVTAAMTADGARRKLPSLARIPVKLLVDDDERMTRQQWEARLRNRLAAASKIFERTCRVRFEAVEVATWDSDNRTTDFLRSMAEFEHEVKPTARLMIGFTSQYENVTGPTRLGGTRAAFYPYILLREWGRFFTEPERLEILVHELGHYLGAIHSAEPTSVMRPMLGDRRSRLKSFRIDFDPVNALAMYLVGEEYRARGNIRKLTELSLPTRRKLFNIYAEIGRTLPNDPASAQYLALLGDVSLQGEAVRARFDGDRLINPIVKPRNAPERLPLEVEPR
jgi:hypothetical protein